MALRRADHSSRGVVPSVLCITECDREASPVRRPRCTIGKKCFFIGALNCKSLSPLSTFFDFTHSFCTFSVQVCISSAAVS
jgi:hypothetical protein